MIETLNFFREEMDGKRIPKFLEVFQKRKLQEEE